VDGVERGVAIAIAAVLALLAAAAPASAEPDPSKAILVYTGDTDIQVIAKFKRAKCKVARSDGKKRFKAKAKSGGWELDVRANEFKGFGKEYPIEYGINANNFRLTPPGTNSYYSNFFFPGDQPPPYGGALALSGNGKDMGLGFISAFFSGNDEDAVGIVGHAKCAYGKKGK
jgi:hypothetical protein